MKRVLVPALMLGALLTASPTNAICYGPSQMLPNAGYLLQAQTNRNYVIAPSRPFWSVVAVQRRNPYGADDYDIRMFKFSSGGADPICSSGELTNSTRGYGTDFIVGDFNYNPYGSYYPRMNCFSGTCDGALVSWRDGSLLPINASPITYTANNSVNDIIQVFDVYLLAGQKYFLNFQQSGDIPWKLLLFRNAGNTAYWAGRNDAVIEADRCSTYVCPFTGYYGVVVVNDGSLGYGSGGFSLSVTTHNSCICPERLVSGTGFSVAGPAFDYRMSIQSEAHWSAVGVRSAGDWDVASWSLKRDLGAINCPDEARGGSQQIGTAAEVIVSDATQLPLPDTLSITPITFSSSSPAVVDFDAGSYAFTHSAQLNRTLGPLDVVEAYDLNLDEGVATHFNLSSYGTAARAQIFRNPGTGRYEAGRAEAILTVTDTATFVAPATSSYGLVLIHEDSASGGARLEWGQCTAPWQLQTWPVSFSGNLFARIVPQDTTWWIAATTSTMADFDMRLYGGLNGPGYPECFSDPGASSQQGGAVTDFVVGDFHHMPLAAVHARFYEYAMPSPLSYDFASVQWRQSRGELRVNGPAVADSLFGSDGHLVGIHQVFLYAGVPYDIHLTPSPFGSEQAFVYGNVGGGTYFAPRSAALTSTNSVTAFVPAFTGLYAIVVAGSSVIAGNTQLWVTSPVADVAAVPPARTALTGLGPNPTRGELRLGIDLAKPAIVTLQMFDVGGREVARQELGQREAGSITHVWKLEGGHPAAAGHYFVRLSADGVAIETRRVTLVR